MVSHSREFARRRCCRGPGSVESLGRRWAAETDLKLVLKPANQREGHRARFSFTGQPQTGRLPASSMLPTAGGSTSCG